MPLRNRVALAVIAAIWSLAGCSPKIAESGVFLDPQFTSLVPPDATLLVGLRVENLVKTPIYQKYLGGGKIPIIDKFARGTGINPE